MIPLDTPSPYPTSDSLTYLRNYFHMPSEIHTEILNDEQDYTSKYMLYLLDHYEKLIDDHPYYTKDSFNVNYISF